MSKTKKKIPLVCRCGLVEWCLDIPTAREAIKRVKWHLDIPVCSILAGIKAHVAAISMKERFWLFYHLGCETAEDLVLIMWQLIRLRRKHKRRLKTV